MTCYDPDTRTGFTLSLMNYAGVTNAQSNWRNLLFGIDAHAVGIADERAGPDAEHEPAPRHMVELRRPPGHHERVMIGQRDDPRAETDVLCALRRRGDKHLGAGKNFKTT